MARHPSVRRLRAASILPVLALAAAGCDDPSGTEPADRPVAITAGLGHTCALTASGAAYCWGANGGGQLGSESVAVSAAAPVRVNAPERLTAISALYLQTCALGASGAAYCWGLPARGQSPVLTPRRVESAVPFASVSAGLEHACALDRAGAAYCWGSDEFGALGDGPANAGYTETPVPVSTTIAFRSIRASGLHTCAVSGDGTPYCWGASLYGLFDDGMTIDAFAPVAAGAGLRFTSFDTGTAWACGVNAEDLYCWGANNAGELGRGSASIGANRQPARVSGLPAVRGVFAGGHNAVVGHTCALDAAGEAYCWGDNRAGEVGIEPGTAPSGACTGQFAGIVCVPEPVRAAGALRFQAMALGRDHTCGITREHEIHCWGRATEGQLGPAGGAGGATPVRVELPES